MIVGVSGPIGAGKTTVCNIFVKKGFRYVSLSDILREECRKRGLEVNRENLRKLGDDLRRELGKAALAVLAHERMQEGNWVVDSIRVPEEVQFLKSKGAHTIGVIAPLEIRYERVMERKRDGSMDLKEFEEVDRHDRSLGIDDILRDADYIIVNDGTLEELESNVENLISLLSQTP